MKPLKERRRQGDAPQPADLPPAPQATPAEADIPELKEKEEERKGAGVPWYAGSGGGPSGAVLGSGGIRVGASIVNPGFLGSARIAAALARLFGGSGTLLGGLFASKMGSLLVLGAMLAWGGLMAAAAIKLLGGMGSPQVAGGPVSLSPMASSGIVIGAPKDRSLGYLANANQGEIQWDQAKEAAKDAAKEAKPAEEAKPETPPEQPKVDMPDVSKLMADAGKKAGDLGRDGFLKKLTNDPSQLMAGGGLRSGTAGFNPTKTFANVNLPKAQLGKASPMRRAMEALRAGKKSVMNASSNRAMGQLKFAKNMSGYGAKAAPDSQAKQYSTDAFEQGKTIGGSMAGVDGGGVVVPPGDGAPGVSDATPDVPPSQNVTPYQPQVDAAKNLDNSSAGLQMMGMILIALGIMLILTGIGLLNCTTFPIGLAFIAAGMALLLMGIMMLAMSGQQAKQAKNQGNQIQQQYGQNDQAGTINDCSSQAQAAGTKADNCMSGDGIMSGQKAASNNVHEATQNESNATYTLDGGNGQESKAKATK